MPWIPRAVWEELVAEKARLWAEVERGREHERRMERVDRRLPELPREKKPKEEVPEEYVTLCAMWAQQGKDLLDRGKRLAASGMPWEKIIDELRAATPGAQQPEGG